MRDDFDSVVADRFKVLDDVPVPDTWSRVLDRVPVSDSRSRVPFTDEAVTMIDLETPVPTEPRRKGPMRVLVAATRGGRRRGRDRPRGHPRRRRRGASRSTGPDRDRAPDDASAGAVRHTRRAARARDVLRR